MYKWSNHTWHIKKKILIEKAISFCWKYSTVLIAAQKVDSVCCYYMMSLLLTWLPHSSVARTTCNGETSLHLGQEDLSRKATHTSILCFLVV